MQNVNHSSFIIHPSAFIGGNIGDPLINYVDDMKKEDLAILELSSFQLEQMTISPNIAAILNVTPNHLDRHGTMENYAAVKARIFARQRPGDTALCSVDDGWCAEIADMVTNGADVRRISVMQGLGNGITAVDGVLRERRAGRTIAEIDLGSMAALKGRHNWQNACMAYGAARALGVETPAIAAAMKSFPGLENQCIEAGEVEAMQIGDGEARRLGLFDRRLRIVPGMDDGAAQPQRFDASQAGSRQPEVRHALVLECLRRKQITYLNFSVDRPTSARTMAMIQKRMTMVDSFQPFCSKW